MGLTIGKHLFYGPFSVEKVVVRKNHHPAVFAVVVKSGEPWDPIFRLLDVGFSGSNGVILREHPRLPEWESKSDGALQIYLYDMDSKVSESAPIAEVMIKELLSRFEPPNERIPIGR